MTEPQSPIDAPFDLYEHRYPLRHATVMGKAGYRRSSLDHTQASVMRAQDTRVDKDTMGIDRSIDGPDNY